MAYNPWEIEEEPIDWKALQEFRDYEAEALWDYERGLVSDDGR